MGEDHRPTERELCQLRTQLCRGHDLTTVAGSFTRDGTSHDDQTPILRT